MSRPILAIVRWRRHKVLSTLATIVAVTESGDYKLKLHSSICSYESDRSVAAFVVLFTSPTALCVVPVTPVLHFMDRFAELVC